MKAVAAAERRRIAIAGASGRMGHMLIEAVLASDDCELAGALDRPDSPQLGQDAAGFLGQRSGVMITDDLRIGLANAQVLIQLGPLLLMLIIVPAAQFTIANQADGVHRQRWARGDSVDVKMGHQVQHGDIQRTRGFGGEVIVLAHRVEQFRAVLTRRQTHPRLHMRRL